MNLISLINILIKMPTWVIVLIVILIIFVLLFNLPIIRAVLGI